MIILKPYLYYTIFILRHFYFTATTTHLLNLLIIMMIPADGRLLTAEVPVLMTIMTTSSLEPCATGVSRSFLECPSGEFPFGFGILPMLFDKCLQHIHYQCEILKDDNR